MPVQVNITTSKSFALQLNKFKFKLRKSDIHKNAFHRCYIRKGIKRKEKLRTKIKKLHKLH